MGLGGGGGGEREREKDEEGNLQELSGNLILSDACVVASLQSQSQQDINKTHSASQRMVRRHPMED